VTIFTYEMALERFAQVYHRFNQICPRPSGIYAQVVDVGMAVVYIFLENSNDFSRYSADMIGDIDGLLVRLEKAVVSLEESFQSTDIAQMNFAEFKIYVSALLETSNKLLLLNINSARGGRSKSRVKLLRFIVDVLRLVLTHFGEKGSVYTGIRRHSLASKFISQMLTLICRTLEEAKK
jgi:hypothetical protein